MTVFKADQLNPLSIRDIKPLGWLKDQLTLQLEGITLRLDEIWGSVSASSDWIGGTDNSWERPPYWLDGMVPLVYLLDHKEGIQKAKKWMEWSITSQRENGDFGPIYRKTEFDDTLFWPKFVMLKAMVSYYEAEQDERVLTFMQRYFMFCNTLLDHYEMDGWAQARAGDFAYTIYWLYEKTNEVSLLELVEKVNRQSLNWTEFLENLPFTHPTGYYYDWHLIDENVSRWHLYDVMKYHATHIVNVTMGLKQPLMEYKRTGNLRYLNAIYTGIEALTKYHGQVTGIFSGDEHLSGPSPTQGSELCSVVELMFSLQLIFEASNDTRFLDLLERVAYNALPATISEDFKAHQYDQQVNQVRVSQEKRNWYNNGNRANLFGLEPNFGCCLANMHQGWPKFIKNAIFQANDTIIAGIYMPIHASLRVNGADIIVTETTKYPFQDTIDFEFHTNQPVSFPIQLRVPGWCTDAQVWINGSKQNIEQSKGYLTTVLHITSKLNLHLKFPMEIKFNTQWYHQGLCIERGPLIYVLNVKEEWHKLSYGHPSYPDYEIYAKSPWNYAIDTSKDIHVFMETKLAYQAFSKEYAPIRLYAKAIRLPMWQMSDHSAGDLPVSPVDIQGETEEVELIPYGCSKLRIALFPWK